MPALPRMVASRRLVRCRIAPASGSRLEGRPLIPGRFVSLLLSLAVAACRNAPLPRVGALYSVDLSGKPGEPPAADGNAFRVIKVLSIEEPAIYLRLYRNRWKERPASVDPGSLTVGRVGDPAGFGVKTLVLSAASFAQIGPRYLREVGVSPEERADVADSKRKTTEDADYERKRQEWLRDLPNRPLASRPPSEYDGLNAKELLERLKQSPSPSPNSKCQRNR